MGVFVGDEEAGDQSDYIAGSARAGAPSPQNKLLILPVKRQEQSKTDKVDYIQYRESRQYDPKYHIDSDLQSIHYQQYQ